MSVRITCADGIRSPEQPSPVGADAMTGSARMDALYHLMHLSGALAEAASVHEVVDQVADHLLLALQAQAFGLLVAEASRARVIGHRGFPSELVGLIDSDSLAPRVPVPGLTADAPSWELPDGVPSFFADREELRTAFPEGADIDDGMGAWAWLPLMVSGQFVDICVVGYARPRHFTLPERTTLTSIGALIVQALHRARQ
ncbi:GAF domain-containing protein [Streptomyces sp. ME19-01-6]|uniref:GAF domain-containing protein n=1 Tax=Streptomyces sp. ME19-01-6 TaxID=3028686 RepID=UPI0029AFA213|nr:GAF domain-containing protein [Streptomyces sp. ME19-01-6]MDX3227620.1 GAF domain-containing protein [Streptomyces sp. ME19-01-6]